MGEFPKIQSRCPFEKSIADVMDGDTCRICERVVVDMNDMTAQERASFLASQKGEVCVSYRFPLRPAIAAALTIVALGAPMVAAAQDAEIEEEVIIVGAILDPSNVEFVADPRDESVPEIAIVYEDEADTDASAPRADLGQAVEDKQTR